MISGVTRRAFLGSGLVGTTGISGAARALSQDSIQIIDSIEPPNNSSGSYGLSWGEDSLWTAGWKNEYIYEINPASGEELTRLETGDGINAQGVTFTGDGLWVVDIESNKLRKLNPRTGNTITKLPPFGDRPRGVTWKDEHLWVGGDNRIYKIDPTAGDVVRELSVSGGQSLAWGSGFLWSATGDYLRQFDVTPSGTETVNRIDVDNTELENTLGLAWDGKYHWSGGIGGELYRFDVGPIGSANEPPTAQFSVSSSSPEVGETVRFDAGASTDEDGFIEQYEWDFTGNNLADRRGEQVSYTYTEIGEYTVTLTVKDDTGVTDSSQETISVMPEATTTATQTTRQETEQTATKETTTQVATTEQTTTQRETRTEQGSSTRTPTTTQDNAGDRNTDRADERPQRGFFSNGDDADPISRLLNLTVIGFVLSVATAIYQLLKDD